MNYDISFAKALKKRENILPDEPVQGHVISVNPVKISIYNGAVILNERIIYLSSDFSVLTGTCTVNGETGTVTIDRTIKTGETVTCIPTARGQKYFISR